MTFKEWIASYNNKDHPYAKLAQTIYKDCNFPIDCEHQEIISYIEREYPLENNIISLFKEAFEDYKKGK